MANPRQSVPENVAGDFFVDSTCIDCDACRQIAPQVFAEADETSYVHAQPVAAGDRRDAIHALLSCPTGSIGCLADDEVKAARNDFPLPVDGPVFYCGFNSPKSFGGNSYFVQREGGNWLIDSPKFLPVLARRLETLGGVSTIFLTHQDDVADARDYAAHFGARRVIHVEELSAQPDAEVVLHGVEAQEITPGCLVIPTPGHTAGHCCLLIDQKYLFTGDHLHWDRGAEHLAAHPNHCWYSWQEQIRSMRRLCDYPFEWVLPGHGQRVQLPATEMREQLERLVEAM
ncbi:MAG: MBL fold metallo-hydrolase [Planctomycetaceae bacterium]|nr:MBL fold metallo-hydrolase [Planctomycetaceae bacterium]